jgi:hypothetical protein
MSNTTVKHTPGKITPQQLFDSKVIPSDNELFATWDYESGKGWIVAWNEDLPAVDDRGNVCESGMRSHFILEDVSKEEAEQFVSDYYRLLNGN